MLSSVKIHPTVEPYVAALRGKSTTKKCDGLRQGWSLKIGSKMGFDVIVFPLLVR